MKTVRMRLAQALTLSLAVGMTSGCWPERGSDNSGATEVAVEDLYPTVFLARSFDEFSQRFAPDLRKLQSSENDRYRAVMRGMAQTIAFKNFDVSVDDFRKALPSPDPFADLPEAGSDEFLKMFYEAGRDLLSDGGMTYDSIQKIGQAHQANAVTKYENALYTYIQALREKQVSIKQKDVQIRQILDLVSFIQPSVERDGAKLSVTVQATNSTDEDLQSLVLSVGAKDPSKSWSAPEAIGSATVQFDGHFQPGETRTLQFSVDGAAYKGGAISLDVTGLTTQSGFSVENTSMLEPLKVIEKLVQDAEWKRRSIGDELSRATSSYP